MQVRDSSMMAMYNLFEDMHNLIRNSHTNHSSKSSFQMETIRKIQLGRVMWVLQSSRWSRLFRFEMQWNDTMKPPLLSPREEFAISITPEMSTFHSGIRLCFNQKVRTDGETGAPIWVIWYDSSRPNWFFRVLFIFSFFRFQGMALYKLHSH